MIWIVYLIVALWMAYWLGSVAFAFHRNGRTAWHYALRSPFFWLVILSRYFVAFPAVKWFSKEYKLLTPFRWLDTIDNDLRGDHGHQTEHSIGQDPTTWWNQVLWLWRNGGNHFNYFTIGVADATAPPWAFWNKVAIPLPFGWFIDFRIGWSPEGPKQGRRKYVMTVRFKTKP